MPIKIPNNLPATSVLTSEEVFVMTEDRALKQDIRPLKLLMLNLMPNKINTEIQYLRKLSNSPLQVNIRFLRIDNHISKNTPQEHLDTFYSDFDEIENKYFDGMIITGAPLDQIDFSDVTYWSRLEHIIKWSAEHVTSTLFSCWGVAAGLKVFYNLDMDFRDNKLSGVFFQKTNKTNDPLVRGFDDFFLAPFSRFIDFPAQKISESTNLTILAEGEKSGVYLAVSPDRKQVYITGHPEYDGDTLAQEYQRDLVAGKNPAIPENYFPCNNPAIAPSCTWRSHSSMLFGNWLNYYVYQLTPYEFEEEKN
ncbi:MAG: homoserine O-succinyltransferase [Succinivibrio sp.]|nr:homoserine O-succinyltransferase [Succinivibrio sp.]